MARRLYLDTDTGRFVEGVNSNIPAALDNLFENDAASYELYFLQRDPSGAFLYEARDFGSKSVKLHIGPNPPSTATAYVVQNSWSDLSSTVSATVTRTTTGGTTANEQQKLAFSPDAQSGTFSLTLPARTMSLTSVTAGLFTTSGTHGLTALEPFTTTGFSGLTGGLSNGQTLYVASVVNSTQFRAAEAATTAPVNTYAATTAGTISTLTASTGLISASGNSASVQQSLEAVPSIGAGNVLVVAIPGREYRIGFQAAKGQVALPLLTTVAALAPLYGKTATINFATTQLANAISGSASLEATLEVEVTDGGTVETVAQVPVTLRNDIITGASPLPVSTTTATFFRLVSPDNTVWSISVDNNGILTTEDIS
jgi:hypothetical protein